MKKRAEIIIPIVAMLICLFINGCTQKNNGQGEENQKKQIAWRAITKEYLLEHFDISEEDLEGVDVESFLSTYDIDVDKIEKYDIPELLKFFVEEDAAEGMMSYEYMLEEPVNTPLTQDNVDTLVRIIWQINEGDGTEALAFDFENERIYEGYRIEEFDKNELIGCADDTIKQKVIQVITDYEIYDWNDYYQGGSTEGTTASYNWQMAIEFSDGTIYRTGGSGLGDKARPDNMEDFIAALRKCEPEQSTPMK